MAVKNCEHILTPIIEENKDRPTDPEELPGYDFYADGNYNEEYDDG